ncbi:hypothetical protein FRB95_000812 [Tulasnella sp. JGI-2019a]|nr:hypothetical protein FRB95_000812 [Tulasnella sp. JGI-2019a]
MPASSVHFRFAIGEYNWNESYVAQSSKGVIWLNVPDDLSNILRRIPCNDILDYSLGSGGKFYIKWKEGGVIQRKLSRGLWQAIDQDPNTSLNRLTLGAENIYWGVCNGADMFYLLESSFRGQIAKQGSIHSIQNFGFFSLGAEHTFCYNLAGTIYTRAKDTRLKNKIQAAKKSGKAILDVVLSPASTTSWIIIILSYIGRRRWLGSCHPHLKIHPHLRLYRNHRFECLLWGQPNSTSSRTYLPPGGNIPTSEYRQSCEYSR